MIKRILFFCIVLLVLFYISKGIVYTRNFVQTANISPINGRVNVVLLGIGGGTHDGADLTDTILVLSCNVKNKTLGMISVPRDIWSDTLKDKVNSAYHYGEEKKKGGGLILSKAIVSDMIGLPIQYGIVVDSTKLTQIIQEVGGISFYRVFDDATDTDMNVVQQVLVAKMLVGIPKTRITQITIEDKLYQPPESWFGRYALLPKESFTEIHAFIRASLECKADQKKQ